MIEAIKEELMLLYNNPQQLKYRDAQSQYTLELKSSRIQPDADYGHMRPVLRFHGTPCFPRQDLVAITGKAKCGKTLLMSILMAAALWGGDVMGFEGEDALLKVMYIDTEQAEYSTQFVLNRVVKLSTLPYSPERFQVFNLRRKSATERLQLVTAAISQEKPDLVIIDGIRDLLLDFNDIAESSSLIGHLMTLASDFDCSIVCALHQNKPKDDNNMRGHLGTELINKAAEVYEMVREDDVLRMRQMVSRNEPIDQDLLFQVALDATGMALPVEFVGTSTAENSAALDAPSLDILQKVFEGGQKLKYNELIRGIWQYCKPAQLDGNLLWKLAKAGHYVTDAGANYWMLSNKALSLAARRNEPTLPLT